MTRKATIRIKHFCYCTKHECNEVTRRTSLCIDCYVNGCGKDLGRGGPKKS